MSDLNFVDIQKIADLFNKSRLKRNGYILMPDINGFKLYEIDQDRLEKYLQAETVFQHYNKQSQPTCPECGSTRILDWPDKFQCRRCEHVWGR